MSTFAPSWQKRQVLLISVYFRYNWSSWSLMAQTNNMAVYLSKEKKAEIFREFGGSESNTGSTEAQIALFTYRIKELSEHLKSHHKDHACRKALLTMVGRRKQMLTYLAKKDLDGYRALIEKLGIRNIRK